MKKYTVLLLRPEFMQATGTDTYLAHVECVGKWEAIAAARLEAVMADALPTVHMNTYDVLFMAEGWIDDVFPTLV